jgi:hypothetical protein
MQKSRRYFLTQGAAAAGAALVSTPLLMQARTSRTALLPRTVDLSPGDEAVLEFATSYGRNPYLVGGGVLGRLNQRPASTTTILVSVDRATSLASSLQVAPFGKLFVRENLLQFSHAGRFYRIENLSTEAFTERLSQLRSRGLVAFAHEAVHCEPVSGKLFDPQGTISRDQFVLRQTWTASGLVAQTRQLVAGLLAAARYGLLPDPVFESFQSSVLQRTTSDPTEASAIRALVLGVVAPLAAFQQADVLAGLVLSPLAGSCFGYPAGPRTFATAAGKPGLGQSITGGPISSAASWLSALAGPGWLKQGVVPHVETVDHECALQTRAAMTDALRLFTENQ